MKSYGELICGRGMADRGRNLPLTDSRRGKPPLPRVLKRKTSFVATEEVILRMGEGAQEEIIPGCILKHIFRCLKPHFVVRCRKAA